MKKTINILLLLLLISSFSCQEGGLEPVELRELNAIEVTGIDEFYDLIAGEHIYIEPNISQNMESGEENLSYLWLARYGKSANKEDNVDTLSYERNLDITVELKPQADLYVLEYYVFDNNTKIFSRSVSSAMVSSDLAHGLLVLSDLNQEARLDYIRFDGHIIEDAYRSKNLESLGTNPLLVDYVVSSDAYKGSHIKVICKDERGGVDLDPYTLIATHQLKDMFGFGPESLEGISAYLPYDRADQGMIGYVTNRINYYPSFYLNGDKSYSSEHVMVVDGKVYLQKYTFNTSDNAKFNYPISAAKEEPTTYQLFKRGISLSGGKSVFYDNENERFLLFDFDQYSPTGLTATEIYPTNLTSEIDFQMVASDWGFCGTGPMATVACVVKNKNNTYDFFTWITGYTEIGFGQRTRIKGNQVAFTEETPLVFDQFNHGFYYVTDNNDLVYYDVEASRNTTLLNLGTNEITKLYLSPRPEMVKQREWESYRLYVASYGGGGQTGSVYEYDVNLNDAKDLTLLNSYENISGRIVDLDYKRK